MVFDARLLLNCLRHKLNLLVWNGLPVLDVALGVEFLRSFWEKKKKRLPRTSIRLHSAMFMSNSLRRFRMLPSFNTGSQNHSDFALELEFETYMFAIVQLQRKGNGPTQNCCHVAFCHTWNITAYISCNRKQNWIAVFTFPGNYK